MNNETVNELTELTKKLRLETSLIVSKETVIKEIIQDKENILSSNEYNKNSFSEKLKRKDIINEIIEVRKNNNTFLNKIRRFFNIPIK